jgi:palmitoyl-protein thioesterase
MTILSSLLVLSVLAPLALTSPVDQSPLVKPPKPPTSLPVVLWHGLGDNYQGRGLADIAELINATYPGTFVHSVYLDESTSEDRNKGFIGHLADQVCSTSAVLMVD